MNVLLAEDDPISRRLLQSYLERWGHQVTLAEDGEEAWEHFRRGRHPIVLTDWMMPRVDGLELIRRIRSESGNGYVYVLVLTARAQTEDLVAAMEIGADDFVAKPFNRDELQARLREGERIVTLERRLSEQNRELEQAREELEERVRERTAELIATNEALQAESVERRRADAELHAAQARLLDAEREKKHFYREVIRAVTNGKLHLCEPSELAPDGRPVLALDLDAPEAYPSLRMQLRHVASQAGLPLEAADDLVLAAGEAATNAIKHASGICCAAYLSSERITVRVADQGQGIPTDELPASVLTAGFSTKDSLGMGYTLMLSLVDRVWLATGPEGTVVHLEKLLRPADEEHPLLAAWDRS